MHVGRAALCNLGSVHELSVRGGESLMEAWDEQLSERKLISDALWEKRETAVAAAKHSAAGAPPEMTDRAFLEALLYLNRTGSPWRDLPTELGYWHAVYMRFRRWRERGVWQRLWKNLQAAPFAQARDLLMDSTTVRAHPHAAGAPKKGSRPGSGPLSRGIFHQNPRSHDRRKLRRRTAFDRGSGPRWPAI